MKEKLLTLLCLCIYSSILFAQTPPARTWYTDDYGNKTSIKERWDEDGNGLRDGKYIQYFLNGNRAALGQFKNGKKTGVWIITQNDERYDITYGNGEKNGLYTYKRNGKIIEKGNYVNDKKQGKWIEREILSGSYFDGFKNGWWENLDGCNCRKDPSKKYFWYEQEVTQDGFRTLFSNGAIIKVLDIDGEDEIEWCESQNCLTERHSELCDEFLKKHPNSAYVKSVELKREKSKIEKTWSEITYYLDMGIYMPLVSDSLKIFIDKYPHSNHTNEAKAYLEEIKYYQSIIDPISGESNVGHYLKMIEKFPQGKTTTVFKEKIKNSKPEIERDKIHFNTDSYTLTSVSEEYLINLSKSINFWNEYFPNEAFTKLYITVHGKKANSSDPKYYEVQKELLDVLSINRCFILKSFLKKHIVNNSKIQFFTYPVSSKMDKGYLTELSFITPEEIEIINKHSNSLARLHDLDVDDFGYKAEGIIYNKGLRDAVMSNLKASAIDGQMIRTIPLELYYSSGNFGLGFEKELEVFKKKAQKALEKSKYKLNLPDLVYEKQ